MALLELAPAMIQLAVVAADMVVAAKEIHTVVPVHRLHELAIMLTMCQVDTL